MMHQKQDGIVKGQSKINKKVTSWPIMFKNIIDYMPMHDSHVSYLYYLTCFSAHGHSKAQILMLLLCTPLLQRQSLTLHSGHKPPSSMLPEKGSGGESSFGSGERTS